MPRERLILDRSNVEPAALLLVYKAICFFLIYLSIALLPPLFSLETYYGNFHWPPEARPSFASIFQTWDAQHYLYVSRFGYQPGSLSNAFYPLWPLCIRLFSYVTLGNYLVAALILSNLFSLAALLALHRHITMGKDSDTADRTVLLMLAFPGAMFLLFPYSESLFLLLAVLIFVQLSREEYLKAGILAFFAALARPIGVFWIAPIGLHILKHRKYSSLFHALFPLLGFLTYLGTMYVFTGDPFEGIRAQQDFISKAGAGKIFDVIGFLRVLGMPVQAHGVFDSALDRLWFAWFSATLWAIYKEDGVMLCYALAMGLVPAMTQSLMSFTRYALMILPAFLVTGEFFSPAGRRNWFYLVLAALFATQVLLLIRHVNFYWVG